MQFTYEAKDTEGKTVSGSINAESERAAATQVRELGYYPLRFTSLRGGQATAVASRPLEAVTWPGEQLRTVPSGYQEPFSRKVYGSWFHRKILYPIWTGISLRDLALFYREFGAMLHAGVPIGRSLAAMAEHHQHGLLATAIRRMAVRVQSGDTLSNAFGEFPYIFNDLQRSMVAAGEESGGVDIVFGRISDYLEREFELREMIKRETFQTKLTLVVGCLVPPIVVWVTQGPAAYFHQAIQPLLEGGAALLFVYCAMRVAFQSHLIRYAYDTAKSFLPWFGTTIRIIALAKFARAFSALYAAGVLIPRALKMAAGVAGNAYLEDKIAQSSLNIESGAGLSQSMAATGAFPPIFLSMVSTGESTGGLDLMLDKVADFYEDESRTRLQQAVKLLGVFLFLLLSIWVGFTCAHMLAPYISELTGLEAPG